MKRRAVFSALLGAVLLGLTGPSAQADASDRFHASISPAAVQPLSSHSYALHISNAASSNHSANNAHVTIPAGFTVDPASLSAATTAAGTCSAATWTVSLDLLTPTINAVAPSDSGSELCPGGQLTISFTAAAPALESDYEWTTTLFQDGNEFSLQGQQPDVTVDGTPPPAPLITSEPPDPSDSSSATFAFSDGDSTATFACSLDGAASGACSSPITYNGLGEGSHTFAVQAVDPAGNHSGSTSYTWTIDLTPPPPPTITSGPPSATDSTSATFTFTDDEQTATFACRLDGASFTSCSSPVTYNGLGEGTHTFRVKAIDVAGNESTVTAYTWTIDTTPPPRPTITSAPGDPSNSASATFAFTDDDETATFRCRIDGGSFTPCTSPTTYEGLSEGDHTFRVKAVDAAGNESDTAQYSWTIDLTPPPPPEITSAPPDPSNSSSATFSFTDEDHSAAFSCRLDNDGFSSCSSPITYNGLGEGAHTFRVRARDPAGNESSITTYTWTIDLTPPPAPDITSAPPSVTASTSATFSFTDGDPTAVFLCSLDDQSFSSCTSPVTYDGLSEGSHTFRVKARDPAGNESPPTSYAWFIDLTNPVVTIDPASEPPDPTNRTSANFVFTSNKEGSTFECRLDEGQFASCASPQGYSGLGDRRHTFGVRATDSLGNQGLETIYSWTVDTVPPATSITSGPPAATESRTATFSFASTELPATFACSLDGSAFIACASPKTYDGLADGAHVFEVRATDLAGNTDASPAAYSWQVSTQAPPDVTPPGTVLELRRSVGWRTLRLSWTLPTDADFDHVEVLRSRSAKGAAQAVVYDGDGTGYSDARFLNGTYYRYEIRSYDHAGNASPGVRVVVRASALLFSPRDGGLVRVPPLFRWARVRSATFYNIQLYRGSRKILSAWPAKPLLKLRRTWVYNGRRYRLRKGGYRWWVWPAFGSRSKPKYGRTLGTGTFRVR
jgi:hypothetical protein